MRQGTQVAGDEGLDASKYVVQTEDSCANELRLAEVLALQHLQTAQVAVRWGTCVQCSYGRLVDRCVYGRAQCYRSIYYFFTTVFRRASIANGRQLTSHDSVTEDEKESGSTNLLVDDVGS